MSEMQKTLKQLLDVLPQEGCLVWIGLRPARRADMLARKTATLDAALGIEGDRYAGRSGQRQVTLIQQEHLAAIASMAGHERVQPADLRRNLVVSGINLLALKSRTFMIGPVKLEYTGLCHPCSRMETTLGPGGYNAMRGHGGITARVLSGGRVETGGVVRALPIAS